MIEYVKALLPHIFAVIIAFLTFLLGRGQKNAEIAKLKAEGKRVTGTEERDLVKFYQDQVSSLIVQVKDLMLAVEQKEQERANCEDKLHELEIKFNTLSTEFNLLKKKLN